jgi:hypothetical protein
VIEVFADLHIHVGQAGGRPIKITASKALTLDAIVLEQCKKGCRWWASLTLPACRC